jgi:hypothetical protein
MSKEKLLGPTKKHSAGYDESVMRAAAVEWLKERHKGEEFLLPITLFHDLGTSIKDYVKKAVPERYRRSVPWWGESTVRPDIIGLIWLQAAKMYGWIVGECKAKTIEPSDMWQAHFYANSTDAYAAYLFWDSKAGFTDEAWESIGAVGAYRAICRNGGMTSNFMRYVMYDQPQNVFIDDLETALVLRSIFPTWKPLLNTSMPIFALHEEE